MPRKTSMYPAPRIDRQVSLTSRRILNLYRQILRGETSLEEATKQVDMVLDNNYRRQMRDIEKWAKNMGKPTDLYNHPENRAILEEAKAAWRKITEDM